MKHRLTDDFERAYAAATPVVQRAFDKQLRLLLDQGPRYRSLRVHPWPADGPDAMHARVNQGWRFYYYVDYYVDGETYVIYWQAHPRSTQRGR